MRLAVGTSLPCEAEEAQASGAKLRYSFEARDVRHADSFGTQDVRLAAAREWEVGSALDSEEVPLVANNAAAARGNNQYSKTVSL